MRLTSNARPLSECCGTAEEILTHDSHTCTFRQVNPDADVHWFQGSTPVNDSVAVTTKQVDEHGWVTIRGSRKLNSSDGPYNCSLSSTRSFQPISCTVQTLTELPTTEGQISGSQRIVGTFLVCVYSLYLLLAD